MGKYTDWYEVELDGYLKGRLPDVQRFEAVKEVANHFAEHVEELVEKGMEPIEAEKAAIKGFGTPRKAAINLMRESQSSRIGGVMMHLGMIGIFLWVPLLTLSLYCISLQYRYTTASVSGLITNYRTMIGLALVVGVLISASSVLLRKVPVRRVAFSWIITMGITTIVCLLAGKQPYVGYYDSQVPNMIKEWKTKNALAFKLADIDTKLRKKVTTGFGDNKSDTAFYLAAIKSEAPKLLEGVKAGYVDVVGTETSGYLVATGSIGKNNIGFWNGIEDFDSKSPFPTLTYRMKYVKDPDSAISAWQQGGYPRHDSRTSALGEMAVTQLNFIAGAEQFPVMSIWELTFKSVGMVAVATLSFLSLILFASWILLLLTTLTFQSSFRRRFA